MPTPSPTPGRPGTLAEEAKYAPAWPGGMDLKNRLGIYNAPERVWAKHTNEGRDLAGDSHAAPKDWQPLPERYRLERERQKQRNLDLFRERVEKRCLQATPSRQETHGPHTVVGLRSRTMRH